MGGGRRHLSPFLSALRTVRPDWEVPVCVDAQKLEELALDSAVDTVQVAVDSGAARIRWDALGVAKLAKVCGAGCILNLANAGPWRPSVPSLVYQRNPIYFDPSWIARLGPRGRLEARARRALAFRAIAGGSCAIAPSRAMASFLRSWPQWRQDWRAVAIHHAVDGDRFAYRPHPLVIDGPFNLTVVSHVAPHKDFETVVRAVAELRNRGFDASARFTVAASGNPPHTQRCVERPMALAEGLAIADHVQFIGAHADVERVYAESSVLVSPSLSESFGFPLVEAMASGTPIVASAIPPSIELLGSRGAYFAPGDHLHLVGALLELAASGEEAQLRTLGQSRRVAEGLSWTANAEAVAALVEDVAAQ